MKRIVVCADGTWNIRDQVDEKSGKRRPTNVTKIARAVVPRANGTDQVLIYLEGVGTHGGIDKFTGGAFGDGIEDNVRSLYRSILYNWAEGDELYFFGFSRGAFTVRTLAGFMHHVGLLEKDDDYYMPEIYACYEKGYRPGSPEWQQAFHNVKGTRACPKIKFIGVWDTVGALGAPGLLGQIFKKDKYAYHDVGLNDTIENAYHALAIDERRKPFAPSIWSKPAGWTGNLEQTWFSGVHCNVGGSETPDGLANIALGYIVEKAEQLGLVLDHTYLGHYRGCFNSTLHDSMDLKYRVLGEFRRPIGETKDSNERIHCSALDRCKHVDSKYDPQNLKKSQTLNPPPAVVGTSQAPC